MFTRYSLHRVVDSVLAKPSNAFSQQPVSSGDNLRDSNQANGPGFEDETNEEQSEEEELREEIEEDVDECNLDPDDPWCASLRGE